MDRRSRRKMEKRLETKQMKLTKQTLKRIIKEEMDAILREEEDSNETNELISSRIGGLINLVQAIGKDFYKAKGGSDIAPDSEMAAKFMQGHAAGQIQKWFNKNLPGIGTEKKKEVLNHVTDNFKQASNGFRDDTNTKIEDIWKALNTHDDQALRTIFNF